jgi:hypothetical protein
MDYAEALNWHERTEKEMTSVFEVRPGLNL